MKSIIAASCFLTLSGLAFAAPEPLQGEFTHDATLPPNKAVWIITKNSNAWRVFLPGANETLDAEKVSAAKRKVFWAKLWWPTEAAKNAECLSYKLQTEAVICYVPRNVREKVDDLKAYASDYFYFDSLLGLQEIRLRKARNRE